jgi:hypothetical protein
MVRVYPAFTAAQQEPMPPMVATFLQLVGALAAPDDFELLLLTLIDAEYLRELG